MGTKITYFYPQVEVGYGLLGHEIPVYADFTISSSSDRWPLKPPGLKFPFSAMCWYW